MTKEQIQQFIEELLNDKKEQLTSQIETVKKSVLNQIDTLSELTDFSTFVVPKNLVDKGGSDNIQFLHKAIKKIYLADNQISLIGEMLEGVTYFCSRTALFLIRNDKLVGWSGKGFSSQNSEIKDDEIKNLFFSLSANTIFKTVLQSQEGYLGSPTSQGDDHLIYSRFGGEPPQKIYVIPFFVKGKPQAVIYSDALEGREISEKEIEILSITGELSLDILPIKQKINARLKTREYIEETRDEITIESEPPAKQMEAAPAAPPPPTPVSPQPARSTASVRQSDPERLARVIINDIILYNQKMVEETRKNKTLYETLKNTILQSRELYLNKFDDLSAFEKELVSTLAKGDRDALKGYKFETI